jgi:hypothetical protein
MSDRKLSLAMLDALRALSWEGCSAYEIGCSTKTL